MASQSIPSYADPVPSGMSMAQALIDLVARPTRALSGAQSSVPFGSQILEPQASRPQGTAVASRMDPAIQFSVTDTENRDGQVTAAAQRIRSGRRESNPRNQFGRLRLYH